MLSNPSPPPFLPEAFLHRASSGLGLPAAARAIGVRPSELRKWEAGAEPAPPAALEALRVLSEGRHGHHAGDFRFIDLFAGIGGMRRAFERAGGECAFTAEWNRNALETYLANHGAGHPVAGDVTKVDAAQVPEHDVLVAGFPCQPFSIAGVSKKNSMGRPHGFADETQGTLFFDVARIIENRRPKAFLLENVRNLASHDGGRTMEVILRTLREELGYSVSWQVVDGSRWVPQKRVRVAIVGFADGPEFDFSTVRLPLARPDLSSVLHVAGEDGSDDCPYAPGGVPLDKYTLSDGLWRFLKEYAAKHSAKGNGFGYGLVGPSDVARTMSARYGKDGSEILVAQEGRNPRRLTPREAARLMGFDRIGGERMKIPVSDAQSYKQFGNSVVVPCFGALAEAMAVRLASDAGVRSLAA